MTDTTTPASIEEQIACVKREIAMRESAYPGWVKRKRMSLPRAEREIDTMRQVLATLRWVADHEAAQRQKEVKLA